jgi:predicted nucleic acid-binding protein
MALLVDTSVWSLAFRRDAVPATREVLALKQALETGQNIVTTGLVLQELLQGFAGPKQSERLIERFRSLPLLTPDREDHINAAGLFNRCRKRGIQTGTIDALLAQLCIHHGLTLLTTDADFTHIARVEPKLSLWGQGAL